MHGKVQLLQVVADGPVGFFAAYLHLDRQWFRHLVVAQQRHLFVIRTYINIRLYGERDGLLVEGGNDTGGLRDAHPIRQVHQLEGLRLTAHIADGGLEGQSFAELHVAGDAFHVPAQRIAIDVEVQRHGRCHQVAVQVGHLLHRHVDVGLLYQEVRLVNLYQQLVVLGHEAVFQVLQIRVTAHWRIEFLVGYLVAHRYQCIATYRLVALIVDIALQALACRNQLHLVIVVTL